MTQIVETKFSSIGNGHKLFHKVTLDEWFVWANKHDPFVFVARRSQRGKCKVMAYNRFIRELKDKQQEQLEQEIWRETHGD